MSKTPRFINVFILTFLLFGMIVVFASTASVANAVFDITRVRGQIFGPDSKPLKAAHVVVVCDGQTKDGTTNAAGKYIVVFFGKDTCDKGDTATITVTNDGLSGSASGFVQETKDGRFVDRNFSVVNLNINVPEFGLFTGVLTALTSVGLFLGIRKKS